MARGEGGYGHSVGRLLDELRPRRDAPASTPPGHPHAHVWKVISREEAARHQHPALVGPAGCAKRSFRSRDVAASLLLCAVIVLLLLTVCFI